MVGDTGEKCETPPGVLAPANHGVDVRMSVVVMTLNLLLF